MRKWNDKWYENKRRSLCLDMVAASFGVETIIIFLIIFSFLTIWCSSWGTFFVWWRRFSESGSSWIVRHCHHFLAFRLNRKSVMSYFLQLHMWSHWLLTYQVWNTATTWLLLLCQLFVILESRAISMTFIQQYICELDPALFSLDLFVC